MNMPDSSSHRPDKPLQASDLEAVTAYLRAELPLSAAIGMSLTSWDGQTVSLSAPLGPNLNHADFAFGGSISSMAILATYSLLFLIFRERSISNRILIQESTTKFLRPIDTDIVATACCPAPVALDEFLQTLARKRKSRISLESSVYSGTTLAATHTGLFVAMLY